MEGVKYPYLGQKFVDQERVIVFFTSENKGVIVYDSRDEEVNEYGLNGEFIESEFTFLPKEMQISITN